MFFRMLVLALAILPFYPTCIFGLPVLDISPRNQWAGAQVAYNFAGNDAFEDNVQVAGQFVLQTWAPERGIKLWGGELEIPFVGNIARPQPEATTDAQKQKARELATSAEGISFGLAPNLLWRMHEYYNMVSWINFSWRTNASTNTSGEITYINQKRLSIGWEILILKGFRSVESKPGSFSIELFQHWYNEDEYEEVFGYPRAGLTTIEFCFVVPLSDQIGVLGNYVINLNYDANSTRVGIILNPPNKAE